MNHAVKYFALFSVFVISSMIFAQNSWTHTYHFARKDFVYNAHDFTLEKEVQQPFTQLLVSWNAPRPRKGLYRFFLEVYDDAHKRWSTYKMYEWGAGVQKSFMQKDRHPDKYSGARFTHVRFEGAAGKKYHTFRVKVVAVNGADIHAMRHIAVNASDLRLFTVEPLHGELTFEKNKKYISGVPCISQHSDAFPESSGWCSPASLAQVIEFYTHKPVNLVQLASEVLDTGLGIYGSWPFNTAQASAYLPEHICYVTRLASVKDLLNLVAHNCPVIISICSAQILPGAPKEYDKGHLITVVGFDLKNKKIICHDTAEKNKQDCIKHYPLKQFIRAWEKRHRLAYVITPKKV